MSDRKHYTIIFMTGFIGFFVGGILYTLRFNDTNLGMLLASLITGLVFLGLYLLYLRKKHPRILKDMKIEQHDEREKAIREKAGHCTLWFIFILMLILFVASIAKGDNLIYLIPAISYVVILIVYLIFIAYFKKKL